MTYFAGRLNPGVIRALPVGSSAPCHTFAGALPPNDPRGSRPISPRDKPSDTVSAGRSDERQESSRSARVTRPFSASCACNCSSCIRRNSSLTGTGGRTFISARKRSRRSCKESGTGICRYLGFSSSRYRQSHSRRLFSESEFAIGIQPFVFREDGLDGVPVLGARLPRFRWI